MFRVPKEIMKKALRIAANHLKNWPEDDWWTLSDDFDLNLCLYYKDAVQVYTAYIYRVEDEVIKTDDWVKILEFVPVEDQRELPEEFGQFAWKEK